MMDDTFEILSCPENQKGLKILSYINDPNKKLQFDISTYFDFIYIYFWITHGSFFTES